jgi:hypothetical protein
MRAHKLEDGIYWFRTRTEGNECLVVKGPGIFGDTVLNGIAHATEPLALGIRGGILWENVKEFRRVFPSELPLYLWMPYRTSKFEKLLAGAV